MSTSVAVFGPDPLLSITIEAGAAGEDIHLHAAGQGVWVARMAAELGTQPVLCSFLGGEPGVALRRLLETLPFDLRITPTSGSSGSYVVDRRTGTRQLLASSPRPGPRRHEVDDLIAATVVAARSSDVLAICNPYPPDGFPNQAYDVITADVKSAGIPVLVDLSSPRLDQTLAHGPDLVKLNDWELAEYVRGPVDGRRMVDAAQQLLAAGAQNVVVTRAEKPILVVPAHEAPYEVIPPALPRGYSEGCGDTMMGAIAAAWARHLSLERAVALGAAAGSVNFLRHGLGTGKRGVVNEMTKQVEVRRLGSPHAVRRAASAPHR